MNEAGYVLEMLPVINAPYALSENELVKELDTDLLQGLTPQEVQRRLHKFGENDILKVQGLTIWGIIIRQFQSPIVYLLLFAAGVSIYFTEYLDAMAIMVVIIINSGIGFYMEYQADQSMQALRNISAIRAKVIRSGKLNEINARSLVPGDKIFLEAGDMVPADARIVKLSQLQSNESALTGESLPVEKVSKVLQRNIPVAEQINMLFNGTFITKGNAHAFVTATGMKTELGQIAKLVIDADQAITPLEEKLESFSKRLIWITLSLVAIIFISGWVMGNDLGEMLRTSIALAVAAIPEGLPIVATLGLARGMLKMVEQNVLVKKLSAVETLGCTTVICTDKTGTLTENKMSVYTMVPGMPTTQTNDRILQACVLCNTATIDDKGNEIGDPLETALLNYAQQYAAVKSLRLNFPKIREEPFSSEAKKMITMHKDGHQYLCFAKGAVEEIVKISDKIGAEDELLTADKRHQILKEGETLASSGSKVIAVAYHRNVDGQDIPVTGYHYLGLIGLMDPLRNDIAGAIAECRSAGVKIIMITGDHPETAREIAAQLGIIGNKEGEVVLGSSMKTYEQLTDADKDRWVNTEVFARVSPIQKLDLINVLQERKFVVGMTGDGVNDAPALKKADIGIAMGLRGTQVAQEVADMILKDDSFSSIVGAIRQGRIIFDNIRKFVIYLLSSNLSEIFVIAVVAVLNLDFQLLPLQILFINLVSDVLPALALGMTAAHGNIMNEPPRGSDNPIIDQARWKAIVLYAIVISVSSLGAVFSYPLVMNVGGADGPGLNNNILFFTLIVSQLLHVFNMHSSTSKFLKSETIRNKYIWYATLTSFLIMVLLFHVPYVKDVLYLNPLSILDWFYILGFSIISWAINQMAIALKIVRQ